jgi:hypothetical protein
MFHLGCEGVVLLVSPSAVLWGVSDCQGPELLLTRYALLIYWTKVTARVPLKQYFPPCRSSVISCALSG